MKDFDRLIYSKTKRENQYKTFFRMACLQNFSTEEVLSNHKKFTNYGKQVPIPFKTYADTERFLKRANSYEGEYTINYQEHFPLSIAAKIVCIDDRFTLPTIIFKREKCVNKFIKWVINQNKWIKEIITNHFNKELITTSQDEET